MLCFFLVTAMLVCVVPFSVEAASADTAYLGVDVSEWNNTIDWAAAASGIDFAVLGIGKRGKLDSSFVKNAAGCAENQIPYGVYYVSSAVSVEDAQAEAALVLNALEGWQPQLPVFFYVDYKLHNTLSDEMLKAVALEFCSAVQQAGYRPGLYADVQIMEDHFSSDEFASLTKWVAEVDAAECSYSGTFTAWQYSWSGRVTGIQGDVSLNYYYGSLTGEKPLCAHENGSYQFVDGVHTVVCSACGETMEYESTDGKKFSIRSVQPVLSDSIVLYFRVWVPEGFRDPYFVFEFNGEIIRADEYTVEGEFLVFTFAGMNPQKLGDNICSTLYATIGDTQVSICRSSFSMVWYCQKILDTPNLTSEFRTMISDLLVYGEKTQIYQNYRTDALVTGLVGENRVLTPSVFHPLDESNRLLAISGNADQRVNYTNINLRLGSRIRMCLTVTCQDKDAFRFRAEVNGRTFDYTGEDLVSTGEDGVYLLYFDRFKAVELGSAVTFTIWEGETQIGRTVVFSVYTYIQIQWPGADQVTRELLEAIYNYGESAKKI